MVDSKGESYCEANVSHGERGEVVEQGKHVTVCGRLQRYPTQTHSVGEDTPDHGGIPQREPRSEEEPPDGDISVESGTSAERAC